MWIVLARFMKSRAAMELAAAVLFGCIEVLLEEADKNERER